MRPSLSHFRGNWLSPLTIGPRFERYGPISTVCAYTSQQAGRLAMSFAVWWILFGVPVIAVVTAWLGLFANWRTEPQTFLMASGVLFPTASTLLACGALAYVQLGGRFGLGDYRVEAWGLLLALLGGAMGVAATLLFRRWFSALALGASIWMSALFLLMASSI